MGKFMDKMINAFGLAEYDEEEYTEVEDKSLDKQEYDNNNVTNLDDDLPNYYNTSKKYKKNNSKIVNIHTNIQMEVVVMNPETFDEAMDIVVSIKEKKPVVINLEKVEHNIAQRITDFVCGACYALSGNIQRVTNQIYIIAPDNVGFAGDVNIKQELETNGIIFPWTKES